MHPRIFSQLIHRWWGLPQIDLFVSHNNSKLQRFLSRFLQPQAEGTDALVAPWNCNLAYSFPSTSLITRFLLRLLREQVAVIAILLFWPQRPWFPLAIHLSRQHPIPLPVFPHLLVQGKFLHPNIGKLDLLAWVLKGGGWRA